MSLFNESQIDKINDVDSFAKYRIRIYSTPEVRSMLYISIFIGFVVGVTVAMTITTFVVTKLI